MNRNVWLEGLSLLFIKKNIYVASIISQTFHTNRHPKHPSSAIKASSDFKGSLEVIMAVLI